MTREGVLWSQGDASVRDATGQTCGHLRAGPRGLGTGASAMTMTRAPFQVLVFPYRFPSGGGVEYAVFRRADLSFWQGVSGGGGDGETPFEAAKREALRGGRNTAQVPVHGLGRDRDHPRRGGGPPLPRLEGDGRQVGAPLPERRAHGGAGPLPLRLRRPLYEVNDPHRATHSHEESAAGQSWLQKESGHMNRKSPTRRKR